MKNYRGSEWNRWDLHVHTASSYDYKYKSADADEMLCQALIRNNIKAVAITDHFKIDSERIKNLRQKAPGIVFFPGVELRTDKGANNLHLILIFSEKSDLKILADDFDAIMIRDKARAKDDNARIYWEFNDIIEFAKKHDALISIHAGRKTNGMDKEIKNGDLMKEAIKSDIANAVHFFEIGQKRDIDDYEKHVFKDVQPKPLIICSDNHSPQEYTVKEKLWIKADLTFEGLKQCVYQPRERVYIGEIPPMLDRATKNKRNIITLISCSQIDHPINKEVDWFNFSISLNPGMVAVIGNKGSGKSAFSDIIGHLCYCKTMGQASFLNDKRFRKMPKNYAKDYCATLTWADGVKCERSLEDIQEDSGVEEAQYLPQKYIEDVCNDFGDVFQEEIDKVIFSYIDENERENTRNLKELIELKSRGLKIELQEKRRELEQVNNEIIKLEQKKTNKYHDEILKNIEYRKNDLERHEKAKPKPVAEPARKDSNIEYQNNLGILNSNIQEKEEQKKSAGEKIANLNIFINDIKDVVNEISSLEKSMKKFGDRLLR